MFVQMLRWEGTWGKVAKGYINEYPATKVILSPSFSETMVYVALAGLELTHYIDLACLCFPIAGTKGSKKFYKCSRYAETCSIRDYSITSTSILYITFLFLWQTFTSRTSRVTEFCSFSEFCHGLLFLWKKSVNVSCKCADGLWDSCSPLIFSTFVKISTLNVFLLMFVLVFPWDM